MKSHWIVDILYMKATDKPGKVLGFWDEKDFWWNAWQGNFPERANELEAKGGGPRRICANVRLEVVERFLYVTLLN